MLPRGNDSDIDCELLCVDSHRRHNASDGDLERCELFSEA